MMMRGTYPLLFMAIDETPELVMLSVKISDPVSAFHTLYGERKKHKIKQQNHGIFDCELHPYGTEKK